MRVVPFHMVAVVIALLTAPAWAAALRAPAGEPILTVTGRISNTNDGAAARFDRAMLEELGTATVATTTPWDDGVVEFEGVLMSALMDAVGAEGTEVVATALDDYRSTIPISDFERFSVLLALRRDGGLMPIRDKGPLFIVYPFDSDPAALRNDLYYGRSVWQVKELDVR